MIKNRPLKFHGGKGYLAQWILSFVPQHLHWVEGYFGGGAVTFEKPAEMVEGHSEVVNDINGDLMNFWAVIGNPSLFREFQRCVELIPFGRPQFQRALNGLSRRFKFDPRFPSIERALYTFIRFRQSRQGVGKSFATLTKTRVRRGMQESVSSWLSAVESLPEAAERLKRVVIECRDALDVIVSEDSKDTLYYLDPPYVKDTRSTFGQYDFEMSDDEHVELLETLTSIRGKFMLSGYRSELYDDFANTHKWRVEEYVIDNKASGKSRKAKKVECLYMNF